MKVCQQFYNFIIIKSKKEIEVRRYFRLCDEPLDLLSNMYTILQLLLTYLYENFFYLIKIK